MASGFKYNLAVRNRVIVGLLALLAAAGCRHHSQDTSDEAARAQPAPLLATGSVDPFARMSSAAWKSYRGGVRAERAHRWDDALSAYRAALTAAPASEAARYGLLRGLVHTKQYAALPAVLEPLYAADYIRTAARVDRSTELAALRASAAWPRILALRDRYRAAYVASLEKGFFFVARTSGATAAPAATDGGVRDLPPIARQELFHYDLQTRRFQRVSDTGGHAFAVYRAADGRSLSLLVVRKLRRIGGATAFVDPRIEVIDLGTLAIKGPFTEPGVYDQVSLAANGAHQPIFTFVVESGAPATYTIDTAGSGLVALKGDGVIPVGGEIRAWPEEVARFGTASAEGVKLTDGANRFSIAGVATAIVAARPIAESSLEWSPSKIRLTYAGKLDACKLLGDPAGAVKNELYVYDRAQRGAQRIASGISSFATRWLDDDHLVYENGVGKDGRLHIYTFSTHSDLTLPTRHGAGLYGVPTLSCEQAEAGGDEDLGYGEDEGD